MITNNLALIRHGSGLKAKHVAAYMEVTVQTMSNWESRKPHRQTYPTLQQMVKLIVMYREIGVELTLNDLYRVEFVTEF